MDSNETVKLDEHVAATKESYEEIMYGGGIFDNTHPDHLYALGKLHGIEPTDPNKCRVLEIGCAIGSNLLPLAMVYPNAEFVGIDLAERHITEANELTEKGELTNITFYNKSIDDIEEDLGLFDYIICHGVFSWVATPIQHAILQSMQDYLTPNGLAIVSYNCKPGWHSLMPIRDAMHMHAQNFSEPGEKLLQAKSYMQFILDSLPQDNEYGNMLRRKYEMLTRGKDYYLYHELLESYNEPLYFKEFMDLAHEHELQYLCETNPQYMMASNLPEKFLNVAKQTKDRVTIEQLHDYISNRQFRSTIIVRQSQKVKMTWDNAIIQEFAFSLSNNLRKNAKDGQWYMGDKNIGMQSENETVNTLLDHLNTVRLPRKTTTLAKNANLDEKMVKEFFQKNALNLFAKSFLQLKGDELTVPAGNIEKLKTHPLIAAFASKSYLNHVPNLAKMQVNVDGVDKYILPLLNGLNSKEDIFNVMAEAFRSQSLKIDSKDGSHQSDAQKLELIRQELDNRLKRYVSSGLLLN